MGYPLSLAGHDIPLSGRLMAVADIYDALIGNRCYSEKIFDPDILNIFFNIEAKILEIAATFQD